MAQFRPGYPLLYVRCLSIAPRKLPDSAKEPSYNRIRQLPMDAGIISGNSVLMDFAFFEIEEPAADIAADVIPFDEYSDADTNVELKLLAARVQAARHCGA